MRLSFAMAITMAALAVYLQNMDLRAAATYSPAAVRRAGRGRFLDLFPGSSITGVNRWLRCLDRLAFVRALQ